MVEGGARERRLSGKSLLRVASSNSINLRSFTFLTSWSQFAFLRDPGKKSFMFFTSELGKGFIISDEEEVPDKGTCAIFFISSDPVDNNKV